MFTPPMRTSFADFGSRAARIVLIATAIVILFGVTVSQSDMRNRHLENVRHRGGSDIRLFQAQVARLQQGEGYYQVFGDELRVRGYPTRSVFNWRPPLFFEMLAAAPSLAYCRVALGGMALAVVVMSFRLLEREAGTRAAGIGAMLMAGALLPTWIGESFVLPEVWAATLIAFSLCAYGLGRPLAGVLLGIAALFAREHAGLYCVVCAALAIRQRQWREASIATIGLAVYGAYYLVHAETVLDLVGPNDVAHQEGWIQLAGAPFVIAACQMNCWLLLLPQWATGLYVPLAMLGFLGWKTPWGERAGLVAASYLTTFAIVGQPFNQYWGVLIAPVLVLGFARAPAALFDLWHAARCSEPLTTAAA